MNRAEQLKYYEERLKGRWFTSNRRKANYLIYKIGDLKRSGSSNLKFEITAVYEKGLDDCGSKWDCGVPSAKQFFENRDKFGTTWYYKPNPFGTAPENLLNLIQ